MKTRVGGLVVKYVFLTDTPNRGLLTANYAKYANLESSWETGNAARGDVLMDREEGVAFRDEGQRVG